MPFEIPESWEWTRVGEVSDTCLGKMLDKQKNQGTNQFYLRNINVRWEGFELTDLLQMPFEANENERYSINYGDLVVCEGGEPGRCAVWDKQESIKFQKALHRVRCHRGIINHYIQYVLKYLSTNGLLDDYFTGSTIKHLTGKALNSVLIPLPPTSEQIRIVSVLKKWITLLEDLEIIKNDLQETIKRTKNKVLSLAISGKLVQQDSNDEPSIELLKRINPNYVPCCDTSHYGKLPSTWCVVKIGDVYDHTTGKALKKSNNDGVLRRYITTSNLYWNSFDLTEVRSMYFTDRELDKCTAKKGDLLVCNGGDVGRAAIWNNDEDICIQNHISRLRPKYDSIVNNLFCCYIFMYLKQKKKLNGKGVAITSLSATDLLSVPIPLPPINEQNRIVQTIQNIENKLNEITAEL